MTSPSINPFTPRKFGKLPPKRNLKTLPLSRYVMDMPAPPLKVYREYKVPESLWGMDGNDQIGDCTCVCIAHMLMLVTVHTGAMVTPTTADVIAAYSAITGYPQAGDNGAAITDVLNYWRDMGISGHKILAWGSIDPSNLTEVRQGVWLFGGVDIGANMPQSAMDQFNNGQPWNAVSPDGGNVGGHSIPLFGYGADGGTVVTWGQTQQLNWDWWDQYVDEAYVVITQDWINAITKTTPSGFDLATLQADLASISTGS